MKLAVIGTGYVGLVSGTCLAESGNDVMGIDKDAAKIAMLNAGKLPIYEPGLQELVEDNCQKGRLRFTTNLVEGISEAQLIFICVGTPPDKHNAGAADLSGIFGVGEALAPLLTEGQVVIIKSTVPVGTNQKLYDLLRSKTKVRVDTASNPEFLKEGAAVDDFMKPDRVVIGVRTAHAENLLRQLYAPFLRTEHPLLVMTPESAEMTKYVANAMLATKISFINEMANLCEVLGADINDVRRGIGFDTRIGFQFLHPGPGYGGSCFPKDVTALMALAKQHGKTADLVATVHDVNEAQKKVLSMKIQKYFGNSLGQKTLAIWGLAFKPRTDDIREAPALVVIDDLLAAGAKLRVHDPEAMQNVRASYGDKLTYCARAYEALQGADALVLVTEWQEFRTPDFYLMKRLMKAPVIFDGRNIYDPKIVRQLGFHYEGIGRVVSP
jgi:UDPglucose 6-dehydrogenase